MRHQITGVFIAGSLGDPVLIVEQQTIFGASSHTMQLYPIGKKHIVCLSYLLVV